MKGTTTIDVNARASVGLVPKGTLVEVEESDVEGFYRTSLSTGGQRVADVLIAKRYVQLEQPPPPPPPPPPPADVWRVEYFNNMTLTGAPVKTETITALAINLNWGSGGPAGLPADGFSARFTRTIEQPAGASKLRVVATTDDGFRILLDGAKVFERWADMAPTRHETFIDCAPGKHQLVFEYYENKGGAVIQAEYGPYTPPPPPPPVQNTTVMIGLNDVAPGLDTAEFAQYFESGCGFATVTFNPAKAKQWKERWPNALIFARPMLPKGYEPSFEQWHALLHEAFTPGMGLFGANENDSGFNGEPDSILRRAEFDRRNFEFARANGMIYAGYGFSMGNPNYVDPRVVRAVHDGYADLWREGMWFNTHSYSGDDHSGMPLRQRIYDETVFTDTFTDWQDKPVVIQHHQTLWLEENWRFLFYLCGLDPANPSNASIVSDETGVDQYPGGFPTHGYTDEEIASWSKRFAVINSSPTIINGVSYKSPYKAGALYCVTNGMDWAGYKVNLPARRFRELGVWR
ncbi:MAG: hypothetical protein IT323_13600 [Anaerolineae bacterium]|nr:hypothetical protein [Anaerolineae bacterium]